MARADHDRIDFHLNPTADWLTRLKGGLHGVQSP